MANNFQHIEWGFEIERKGDTTPSFEQVHGTHIVDLDSLEKPQVSLIQADGGLTRQWNLPVSVYSADCYPVLFFTESIGDPIVAVHAGWKGIFSGIVSRAVHLFASDAHLHCVIGPAIGACCFAVREDFIQKWDSAGLNPHRFLTERSHRLYFNLLDHLRAHDLKTLPSHRIHLDQHRCTVCSKPELPSFRRNKSANPRIRSWILKRQ
ncbi:laccase domain-containing protein [bacterium]|nr:laccase domain-containing protein [bacterium]